MRSIRRTNEQGQSPAEKSGVFIDRSRLYGSDLMPAETFAHDIETGR
jgi:hypothetical protein